MATIIGDGIQPQKQWLYRGCLPGMYKWDWIDLTSNCLGYTLLRFPDPHLDHWMTAVTKHIPYANGAGICTNKTAPVFYHPVVYTSTMVRIWVSFHPVHWGSTGTAPCR